MNLGKRVRFAPSPTGFLHLGGLRTALFNFLYARSTGREMILRIEDTDASRNVAGATESIVDTLKWAGINYDYGPDRPSDFGPFVQSQRLDIYRKYAQHLISEGKAFVSEGAVKFKRLKEIPFKDAVYGGIPAAADMQRNEPVLMKSDGFPTYHFANVVDDHTMDVGLVMRGMEWIPSTALHLELYEALGWQAPVFAHLPLLVRTDGSKLSKRQRDAFVEYYRREKDILPSSLVNFVAFLGWTPTSKNNKHESIEEVMSMEDLIGKFRLEDVNKSEACVDNAKLMWFNRKHLPKAYEELSKRTGFPADYCKQVLLCMQDRAITLSELLEKTPYFFSKQPSCSWLEEFRGKEVKAVLDRFGDKKALRMMLTASPVGPPLSELIRVLLLKPALQ